MYTGYTNLRNHNILKYIAGFVIEKRMLEYITFCKSILHKINFVCVYISDTYKIIGKVYHVFNISLNTFPEFSESTKIRKVCRKGTRSTITESRRSIHTLHGLVFLII